MASNYKVKLKSWVIMGASLW